MMDFQLDRRGFDSAPGHHASPFGLRVAQPRQAEGRRVSGEAFLAKTDWRGKE